MHIKEIRELIKLIEQSNVDEFEMERSGVRIRIRKTLAVPTTPPAETVATETPSPPPAAETQTEETPKEKEKEKRRRKITSLRLLSLEPSILRPSQMRNLLSNQEIR